MAGISGSWCALFNPSSPITTTSKFLTFSASLTPKLHIKIDTASLSTGSGAGLVLARFGGYRPGPRPKRSSNRDERRRAGPDSDDEALDISRITSSSVRLIDPQQNMVGVVSINEAIRMAEDAEKDLVILSPDADPPVLRIMDYNKYKYEQQKRRRDQQKKSSATRMDMKELKMGYNIDTHDYTVRLKAAKRFLNDGDKVKVIVNLKGRQNEFRDIAIELLKRFQTDVGELGTLESKNFNDRNMFMGFIPNKTLIQKGQEQPKKNEPSTDNKVSANL
ncbi:Translation initiation factor IF-3 [Zostera marina]|uniref:Translation initiation factor IF-3 n=1 Tax=Zostera marina TaxID=29655 RepID=A0A0K9PYY8_ZOSMR|nr:Translation initiation factor IF-3 [Zostera marina]